MFDRFLQRMNNRIERIEKTRSALLKLTTGFESVKCAKHDPLRILLVLFLQRFLEHSKSIQVLNESRDHLLIARSVIEGGVILKWILNSKKNSEKSSRARKYFELTSVVRKERADANGIELNADQKLAIKKPILATQDLLSPGEYNNVSIDLPISFVDFLNRLTDGMSIASIIKDVKTLDRDIYNKNYNYMSGFHHWNAFYMFAKYEENGIVVFGNTDHAKEYELSLMSSLVVLAETALQLSVYAGLRKERKIFKLIDDLYKYLQATSRKESNISKRLK